jgi:hypothetical protein
VCACQIHSKSRLRHSAGAKGASGARGGARTIFLCIRRAHTRPSHNIEGRSSSWGWGWHTTVTLVFCTPPYFRYPYFSPRAQAQGIRGSRGVFCKRPCWAAPLFFLWALIFARVVERWSAGALAFCGDLCRGSAVALSAETVWSLHSCSQ